LPKSRNEPIDTKPIPVGFADASPKPLDHQPERKLENNEPDVRDPFSNGNISPIAREESAII
jgi:hypothetical protein